MSQFTVSSFIWPLTIAVPSRAVKMWRLVLCAMIAAVTAQPPRNYDDLSQYLRISTSRRNSFLNNIHQVEVEMQKRCQMYGGDNAYENFMATLQEWVTEVRSAMFVEIELAANNGENTNVGFYCRLAPTIKKAIENIMDSGKNCVSPLKREEITEAINITSSTLDYICQNEGERIESFVENGGLQCLTNKNERLMDCVNESVGSNLFNLEEPKNEEDNNRQREKECQVVFQLESCVKKQISECQNPSATNFIEGVLASIISPSCKKTL